ncbi:MAG: carbohydrate-binding domain-containing protein [Lentisphaeria bacterium]|nr:carbohydrate-binding domain-containing protein [Lentisphaeria bacterium]
MTMRIRWFLPALLAMSFAVPAREVLALNGVWSQVVVASPEFPVGEAGWADVAIPATVGGNAAKGTRYIWYRRNVALPEAWAGQRIFLKLWGARYAPAVFVDGNLIAERLEGWTPFEVELTGRAKPGTTVEVAVRCQDWSATFADGFQVPEEVSGDLRRSAAMRGRILAPIGGHWGRFGLWDEVELIARPAVYLDDVAIDTSVQRRTLTVRGRLAGTLADATVSGTVLDGGKAVISLPAVPVGAEGSWSLKAPFGDVELWSDANPKLYELRLELRQGDRAADDWQSRIGFRELWREGFEFRFNGVKRHLLASSGWPVTDNQTEAEVREGIRRLKAANCHVFRLHTQPWQRKWLDIADEEGLLIVEEGALWCDGAGLYAYQDARLWENIKEHLAGMVRRDRNHACLVMWSIENELLHCGAGRYDPKAEEKLADVGAFVKVLDPTHLITFESDHDPGGVADVIGLHYPHEMPRHTDYPNTADWLDQTVTTGTEGDLLGSRRKDFHWERDKPLYIGEYLWVPSGSFAPGTVFYGDEAYRDRQVFNERAKADSWLYQTLAYRRAGVSGLCPWTFAGHGGTPDLDSPLHPVQKYVYEPVALYPREYDSRFFGGRELVRHFDVFNDSPVALDLRVVARLGEQTVESPSFRLEPAGQREVPLRFVLPSPTAEISLPCRAVLLANGEERHAWEGAFRVFPETAFAPPPGVRVVWYEPEGSRPLPVPGDRLREAPEIDGLDAGRDILVIAPSAFRAPPEVSGRPVIGHPDAGPALPLSRFFAGGGRVLVLEQDTLAGLPFGVSLVEHASTIAFPLTVDPTLLKGIGPADLRFWAGDHYVTRRELNRPASNGGRTLLVSGGEQELAQGPLVEVQVGSGRALLCQALVGEKYASEPMARLLLRNCLDSLASRAVLPPRPALIHAPDEFCALVERLGFEVQRHRSGQSLPTQPGGCLILHGAPDPAVVREYLAGEGRTVYWHAPDPASFAALAPLFGAAHLEIVPGAGPLRLDGVVPGWLDGLSREDIYFVGDGPIDWLHPVTPAVDIVDTIVLPRSTTDGANRRLEALDLATEIKIERRTQNPPGVWFHTGGRATGNLTVSQAGYYRVDVVAGGTPAANVYPQVRIKANGRAVAEAQLTQGEPKAYPMLAPLPAGEVALTVEYVNDQQLANEDRNLFLQAVELGAVPVAIEPSSMPVMPPALVEVKGRNRLVLDTIRWDRASLVNQTRAQRLACTQLTNLGVTSRLPQREPEWIRPAHLDPVGEIPYFKKTVGQVSLVAAGTVETTFECLRSGNYAIVVRGFSKPAAGEYAKVRLTLDGKVVGEKEIASPGSADFEVVVVGIAQGEHHLTIEYTNDLYQDGQDRNLYLNGIGFRQ